MPSEIERQRAYYARTAEQYEHAHLNQNDEHDKAISVFISLARSYGNDATVLDIGSGTGRAIQRLRDSWPNIDVMGIEPVEELRRVGYENGISPHQLVAGDALHLLFDDNSFDWVIETGALHHISRPALAVSEMVRVARKGVMISDSNNIGQGGRMARRLKYLLKYIGLWRLVIWIQTRGKMYKESDGDGIYYSYSAFDQLDLIIKKFPEVHYLNTTRMDGYDLHRGASNVMIFAHRP